MAGDGASGAEYPVFIDYAEDVYEAVAREVTDELSQALTIAGKHEREAETDRVKALAQEKLAEQFEGREKEISAAFRSLTKKLVRERIISDGVRIDGRGLTDIRPLAAMTHVLPRVHGSALFERGETQILGVTTLNMLRMEQMIDTLNPDRTKRYMHNYNFPPYSTGETGRVGSPKRREIGHGALAERALLPVLPTREEFPYAIRQVSEAISSNGSTSMGSVCASTMSLLDAGVPLKDMVSGIAMGLIHEGGQYVTLTDILGAEDAFGDMDFKVAGTERVVTALQLDTKLDGIPASVLAAALKQARAARLTVLDVMRGAITEPGEMSAYAPRIITIKVPVDKIGEVIGPKGKMINSIQDDTGAEITIEDDGTIYVGATDGTSAEAARAAINAIANPHMPEVGERFLGTVVKTTTFGAFVSLLPGKDGLLHITQIRKLHGGRRIENIDDVVHIGDKIQVEIREVDDRGKLSLVPVEVVEREAAGEDLSGGDSRGDRPREHREPRRPGRPRWRGRAPPDQAPHPWRAPRVDGYRTRSWSQSHGSPRGFAGSHRVPAGGALGRARHLGGGRLARRGPRARGRDPLPGAPAVQGHQAAHRAGDIRGDGRGRRRDERVHRQGVHLLLRAGARRGSAAGRGHPVRHGDQLADRAEGRGRRAQRGARRDRDERRRSLGHRARGVHLQAVRRHPAGPADPGHHGLDQRDQPGTRSSSTTRPGTRPSTWWWPRRATWTTTRWWSWSGRRSARRSTGPPSPPCPG